LEGYSFGRVAIVWVLGPGTGDLRSRSTAYTFNNIPVGTNVSICVEHIQDPLNPFSNEVTICDLITLSKHILGIEPITDIQRLLCSDVNQSGTVSTFDIVEIRKNYMLSRMDPLGNIPPQYLFLPDGTVFPGQGGPYGCLNIEHIQGSVTNADFVRIAVGDADGSGANCTPVVLSPFQFITTNKTFSAGETFTIDITPEIPVQGFQCTLEAIGLTIDTIVAVAPYFPPSVAISGSIARLVWIGDILSLQTPTLQVTLTANVDGNLSDHLAILTGTNQLAPVVTSGQCMSVLPGLEFKTVSTGEIEPSQLRLFPNPWREKTNLKINALASSGATIFLTDASGKVLFTQKVQLAKGYNVLTLNREEIAVSGIIFYRVVTPGTTWSGTMMKL
jgi:hypothetical protein